MKMTWLVYQQLLHVTGDLLYPVQSISSGSSLLTGSARSREILFKGIREDNHELHILIG